MTKNTLENTSETTTKKKKVTAKQIAAIVCIVILALLYAVTLITAFIDGEYARTLFGICFFATIALPLALWVYIWIFGKLTGKSTVADFNMGGKEDREPANQETSEQTED